MDIAIITTLIGIGIVGFMMLLGYVFGGAMAMVILGTLALIGMSILPSVPIIPIWITIVIIVAEIIFIAYKIAQSFGLGQGGGFS